MRDAIRGRSCRRWGFNVSIRASREGRDIVYLIGGYGLSVFQSARPVRDAMIDDKLPIDPRKVSIRASREGRDFGLRCYRLQRGSFNPRVP